MGNPMSGLVILGDTSGSVTLNAPAIAGNGTVTLPTTGGTVRTTTTPGTVLQVIDSGAMNTSATNTTTTFVDANCTASITPTSSTSKILITVVQEIQVWNSGNPYATGRWKLMRNIAGGSFSDIYIDYSTSNGNIFAYDYGGSGINVYSPMSYTMIDAPSTTSVCVYKTQIAKGSNGGQLINANANSPGRMILMEIAA